jgi:hypothetical protein
MQPNEIFILALFAIVLVVAVVAWIAMRWRHTTVLREKFGDEYDRTVQDEGKRAKAEAALEAREKRVAKLDIHPLTAQERGEFSREWREVKAIFVDSPIEAVHHADRLLTAIMKARGFPMADFKRRYEDLTVDHGEVARHYREGHEITLRHQNGQASTEDLRQAMVHFEALFDDLVNEVAADEDQRPLRSRAPAH